MNFDALGMVIVLIGLGVAFAVALGVAARAGDAGRLRTLVACPWCNGHQLVTPCPECSGAGIIDLTPRSR